MIEFYSPFGIHHVLLYSIDPNTYHSTGNTHKYQQIDLYIYQCDHEYHLLQDQSEISAQIENQASDVCKV